MVAVLVVDGARRCRFLNAAAEQLTGLSNAKASNLPIAEVLWRGNPIPFDRSDLGHAMATSGGGEGEAAIFASEGAPRPVAFRVLPLGDETQDSAIIELIDLSGETGTARALRESEQRLRLAVEATGIGIWDVNAVTGRRSWSPEMYAILGVAPEGDADQEIFSSLIHPQERAAIDAMYARAYSSPEAGPFNAEFRIRRANDGQIRWVAVSGRVTFDASGKPLRGVGTIRDIHDRRQIEEALRESEGRLRVALAAGRMGTWSMTFATGEQRWDATQYRLLGVNPSVKPSRELFLSLVHPDDLGAVTISQETMPAPGTFLDTEFRIRRPDGALRWISASSLVGYDSSSTPFEMIGMNWDVTEAKEREEALRDSEERNRLAIEANDVGTWDYDIASGAQRWSPTFKRLWGLPEDAPSDPRLLDPLVAEVDRARMAAVWQEGISAEGGGRISLECQIHRADDGAARWCLLTGRVLFDTAGRPVRALGILTDVTERREVEERQRLILREMNHRVKNSLALVQAIVSQTIRSTADPEVAFERIQSRIMSLARTHDFLNRANWAGVSLRTLVNGEIEPFVGGTMDRVILNGEQVVLDSSTMFALGLTFHELASNAVRHGALSVTEGRVDVSWRVVDDGARRIEIEWREHDGPPVPKPTRKGFGTRLIQANVNATLGGKVEADYAPEGLRVTMSFPLKTAPAEDSFPEQAKQGGRSEAS